MTVGLFHSSCPHCKSVDFRAVGVRNSFEKAINWIVQPYRCGLCGHHFFLPRWQAPLADPA